MPLPGELKQNKPYHHPTQAKNLAWLLPRPKPDKYPGGMPLHCEEWLITLAKELLNTDKIKLLNLFCGKTKYGFRVDIKPEVQPDLVCDGTGLVIISKKSLTSY